MLMHQMDTEDDSTGIETLLSVSVMLWSLLADIDYEK
jgi:hypothetical protein